MSSHRFRRLFGSSSVNVDHTAPSPSLGHSDSLQDDLPNDIEFLSLDGVAEYDEPESFTDDNLDDNDEDSDGRADTRGLTGRNDAQRGEDAEEEEDLDWPEDSDGDTASSRDAAVHIEGLPRSELRLEARQYKTEAFAASLFKMLHEGLAVPGWAELGSEATFSQMNIHKVSGSLTNAVFFISYPLTSSSPDSDSTPSSSSPPTVLLRIYGPSSGNLISRKKELHVLNTLSAVYRIGPAILGTFSNGRVEEYFESRALYKEELREPRTSRWIARRMRELHRVDLGMMELLPDQPAPTSSSSQQGQQQGQGGDAGSVSEDSTSSSSAIRRDSMTAEGLSRRSSEYAESFSSGGSKSPPHRPYARPYQPVHHGSNSNNSSTTTTPHHSGYTGTEHSTSGLSQLSTSSTSSIYSYSSSHSSNGSSSSYLNSPYLRARRSIDTKPGVSEGTAPHKKRSLSSIRSRLEFSLETLIAGSGVQGKYKKPRSVVWQNIENWTKEARKVLKRVDKLEKALASTSSIHTTGSGSGSRDGGFVREVNPLLAPSLLVECKKLLDLHRFAKEIKRYRRYIEKWEVQNGKSKRVFAHNDTQCGNILRLTPGGRNEMVPGLRAPHEMLIVVDFEYAGVNPRAFDIANHFLEWQTDYHHPTLSHSVTKHGDFPSLLERQRFYRAYIPCDGGFDTGSEPSFPSMEKEDARVQRLEEEVQMWLGASHAMYVVWSVVQATDDIVKTIEGWLENPTTAEEAEKEVKALHDRMRKRHAKESTLTQEQGRPKMERGKSGDIIHHTGEETEDIVPPQLGDFDYMGYALERVVLFRDELKKLGIKS